MKKLKIGSHFKTFLLCILTILYTFLILHFELYYTHYKQGEQSIEGYIQSITVEGDKVGIVLKGKEKIMVNYYLSSEEEKESFLNYKLGDRLKVEGELVLPSKATIFHGFNYRNYLRSKKIYYVMSASKITKTKNNTNILYTIKNKMEERIEKRTNKDYLKTFLLGDKSLLEDSIKQSYQDNGISHLLAISGMHISLFVCILSKILSMIRKGNHHRILCIFLLLYSFLVNLTPSVIRASMLFAFSKSKIDKRKIFLWMTCVFLFINPFIFYDVGFLFSFVTSGYLLFFGKISNRFSNYFIKLLITSLLCFFVSFPICVNTFFEINMMSIFFNLFFIPLISFFIFPLCLLVFIFPFLEWFLTIGIHILESLSLFCNTISIKLIFCYIPWYIVIVYYLIITITLYKPKWLWILLLFFIIHYSYPYLSKNSSMTLLDVGQGDSIFLKIKNKTILIDTGGVIRYPKEAWQERKPYSLAINKIIPYLKSKGISSLDYLILTHGDFDHMGEAIHLVNNFKVDQVIFNNDSYNDLEIELIKVLDEKKIKYYKDLKELNVDKYKLRFLNTKLYDNENDNSNVIYFNYNNYKFLFMGDAGLAKEKDILEKYNLTDIDFLKVGHHGSNTSSSQEFINRMNPKYSFISVGKNNRYGHPKKSVLDILKDSQIYRTDLNGSVEIRLNNNGYKIRTCPS